MRVSNFDFELPEGRIALRPCVPRDAARMMVVRPGGIEDSAVLNLADHLSAGDLLVLNDTKVLPVRLEGKIGEGRVEATLLKPVGENIWIALCKPGKRFKPAVSVDFDGLKAEVKSKGEGGEISLEFHTKNLLKVLDSKGKMPLPPYIASKRGINGADKCDYQTVYARESGAVAAPTAGLHFTPRMFEKLSKKGVEICHVTLHVGAGTFLPVKVSDTDDHKMHAERGEISKPVADKINAVKKSGGRIVAVGTTSLRLLETAADETGQVHLFMGETDIFITPGYKFKAVDVLMTNFHLPRSTLFMLVSAFSGLEHMKAAYRHAIKQNYRFYSYGDSCLLYRSDDQI